MNILLFHAEQYHNELLTITQVQQCKHVQQVLGLTPGARIKIGQVDGCIGSAIVDRITQSQIILCEVTLTQPPPAKLPVRLIICLPRPKALRRLIKDAVTLGVTDITLLHSYRVEKSYWHSPLLGRLDDYVWEGLEQAGDTRRPMIHLEKRFKPFVEDRLPQYVIGRQAWVAHPYAEASLPTANYQPATIVLGPEGGFTQYELDLLVQQGCQLASLGQRILRCETAMTAVLSRLFAGIEAV